MLDAFQCSKFSAISTGVEGEFNDLNNRVLKNDCRPMRLDKFVSLHLKSFSGKAKLAAAVRESDFMTENESQQRDNTSLIMESTIKTEEDRPSSSLEKEGINNLLFEQNWKNKNISTKIKRSYLQEKPDWSAISIAKNTVGITLLKNGNLCPAL